MWCAGICWIPGQMHLTAWTSGCGDAPPPFPHPAPSPSPRAPLPRRACPWTSSWPLVPGRFSTRCLRPGPPRVPRCCCPWRPARVLAPVTGRCSSSLRPSRTLARALRCAPCPSVRCPRSGPPRVPVLPRCRWPWCPARVLALSLCVWALVSPLRPSLGAPPVAFRPSPPVPAAGTLPCLCAVSSLLNHAPGVSLPPQLRQHDAWRRRTGRRGADGPRLSLGEGSLGLVRLEVAGVGVPGLGVGAVRGALSALRRGFGGSQRGARGPPGARPLCLWRAGCRGAASWGRGRSSLCNCGAGWLGPRPERRGQPHWPARAPGPAARGRWGPPGAARPAARPALRPPLAAAPRPLRGFSQRTPGRRGSGSGTGGGGCPPTGGRTLEQAFAVECFEDIVLFVPLLAPAAS